MHFAQKNKRSVDIDNKRSAGKSKRSVEKTKRSPQYGPPRSLDTTKNSANKSKRSADKTKRSSDKTRRSANKSKRSTEETTEENKHEGNLKGATKLIAYDPNDIARTTLKETLIHDTREGNINLERKTTRYLN